MDDGQKVAFDLEKQFSPVQVDLNSNTGVENALNAGVLIPEYGCKWSPDGTCLMTCAEDNVLRLYDLPTCYYQADGIDPYHVMTPSLHVKESDLIYDYCWYPLMSSWNQETCLLASTSKNSPVHLFDAYSGKLLSTYRAYNNVDEVEAASSLCISPDGEKIYCGFDKCIRVFNTKLPGRECETRPTKFTDGTEASQSGIISCIAVNPCLPSVYAAGSYMKTIGLYSEPEGTPLCILKGHKGGVTHLKFSPDGLVLYSGGRKDPEILCWDLRNPGSILFTVNRTVATNQRIYFDLDATGRHLISGETSGNVKVWDTHSGLCAETATTLPELSNMTGHNDCVNGVSCHPSLALVATSSGQRHVPHLADSSGSESGSDDQGPVVENRVKIWRVPTQLIGAMSAAEETTDNCRAFLAGESGDITDQM